MYRQSFSTKEASQLIQNVIAIVLHSVRHYVFPRLGRSAYNVAMALPRALAIACRASLMQMCSVRKGEDYSLAKLFCNIIDRKLIILFRSQ